jgi:hypothetical protein
MEANNSPIQLEKKTEYSVSNAGVIFSNVLIRLVRRPVLAVAMQCVIVNQVQNLTLSFQNLQRETFRSMESNVAM